MKDWIFRRIILPIVLQLQQGNSPDKLALSIAMGVTLACCPLFGVTTLFCLLAGIILKLNHPTLQLANYMAAPLQLALIVPFCRLGERLFGVSPIPLNLLKIIALFKSDFGEALGAYGMTALRGAFGWCLVAPVIAYLIYKSLLPILKKLARAV